MQNASLVTMVATLDLLVETLAPPPGPVKQELASRGLSCGDLRREWLR
jgi:hypothetical protein